MTPHTFAVKTVPTDGFLSITVYGMDNSLMIAQAVKISEWRKHFLDSKQT